jgi:poly(A) polymerase
MKDGSISTLPALYQSLSPAHQQVVTRLGEVFAGHGAELYLVGGPVRDLLLGAPPVDLDFTTDRLPAETELLGREAGAHSVFLIGETFGTVGFAFPGTEEEPGFTVEITTYRRETYPDATRKPAVEHGVSLIDDLSRRDFTINAIAAHPLSGELVDPYDGQADLALAVLRAVGDPAERFHEDPLRLLRAARFVAQLGFRVDYDTRDAMERTGGELRRISVERIYHELTRMLCGRFAGHGLDLLLSTGIFTIAMPELQPLAADALRDATPMRGREKDLWEHTLRVVEQAPARPNVRWAALVHDAAKPVTRTIDLNGEVHFFGHEREGAHMATRLLRRLNAPKGTTASVANLVDYHLRPATYGPDWTDSAVRRLMLEVGDDLDDLLDLVAADVTSAREQKQKAAAKRVNGLRAHITRLRAEEALNQLQSPLDGQQLMGMFGHPPGRWIATIKDHLRELVIDGELAVGDVERATEIARAMVDAGEVEFAGR